MQFLISRLASPMLVNFDEDDRIDALSLDDQITSSQPMQQQRDCAEKCFHSNVPDRTPSVGPQQNSTRQQPISADKVSPSSVLPVRQQQANDQKSASTVMPSIAHQQDFVGHQMDCAKAHCHADVSTVARQEDPAAQTSADSSCQAGADKQSGCAGNSCCTGAVLSDTESTMSLNELLDCCQCQCDTDTGDTFAVDSCDVDDCTQSTVSHSDIVTMLHVSINPDAPHTEHIQQLSENVPSGLNSPPSKCIYSGDMPTEQNLGADCAMPSNRRTVVSSPMQRSCDKSNISSSSSSSDRAHTDDGYHSNATSALSREAAVCDNQNNVLAVIPPLGM